MGCLGVLVFRANHRGLGLFRDPEVLGTFEIAEACCAGYPPDSSAILALYVAAIHPRSNPHRWRVSSQRDWV